MYILKKKTNKMVVLRMKTCTLLKCRNELKIVQNRVKNYHDDFKLN